AAWPHAAMPIWMQVIAEILPSTQMVQMFIQLNQMGVPTALILPKLIYLGLIGSLCFFLAYRRLIQVSQSR
ncbi:MAG: ABC transporter permease, partial [Gammaproteobacteria bacterium]|nr:ABC transporter permease [Gammaproteobacteria bacterium]